MSYNFSKHTLKNGTRVIIAPDLSKQVVTTLVLFGVGSRYENEVEAGISHVLEHMFFKGSKKRPTPIEIAEFIDEIGGESNAFTSKEYTGFYTKVASKYFDKSVDFLSDLLLYPKFLESELSQEKKVILQEVDMYEDLPMELVGNKFDEALFGQNSLGRDTIGRKESIKAVSPKMLFDYRAKYYTGPNAIIVVAGNANMSAENILSTIEENFTFSAQKSPSFDPLPAKGGKNIMIVEKETEQSHLVIGFRGAASSNEDKFRLKMLSLILGGSMSSRLFVEIREKRGLAYAVRSNAESYHDTGSLETYAGVPLPKVYEALEAIMTEYRKAGKIKPTELKKAKSIIYGRTLITMEDTNDLANHYAMSLLYAGKILTPDEVVAIYGKITEEELALCAQKYFGEENLALGYIGKKVDQKKIEQILKI